MVTTISGKQFPINGHLKSVAEYIDNLKTGSEFINSLPKVKDKQHFIECVKQLMRLEYDKNNRYDIEFNHDYSHFRKLHLPDQIWKNILEKNAKG